MQTEILKNIRHNIVVNLFDAAFFGFAMGFVSTATIIPLFVDTLTNNTAIIGLLSSVHAVGWQLPQVLTANRVASLSRYKPMVLMMTLHERLPYFLMVPVVVLVATLGNSLVLVLSFILLTWRAMGGGFTGTAWQSMIGKVIPQERRGAFFGMQSASANIFAAGSGYLAGRLLVEIEYPYNFATCFALAGFWMMVSWVALSMTREPERENFSAREAERKTLDWSQFKAILCCDSNFRMFVLARFLTQISLVGLVFYTIYGVRELGLTEANAGALFSVLMISATIANPILGRVGDTFGHRRVIAGCLVAVGMGAVVAMLAPSAEWLYLVFILSGFGHVGSWTIAMAMTVEFGTEDTRPYYIALTNTLIAPATLIAPFLGGWLVDHLGFDAMFTLAITAALMAISVLMFLVHDPHPRDDNGIGRWWRRRLAGGN